MDRTMEQLTQTSLTNPNTSQQNNFNFGREITIDALLPAQGHDQAAAQAEKEAIFQEQMDAQELLASGRGLRLTRLQKLCGALGMGGALGLASLGLTACDPINNCPRNFSAEAIQCFKDNTGVLRSDGVRERWTQAEILSGAAGLDTISGDLHIYEDNVTISNKRIFGCVGVHGDNVTMHDVYIESDHACTGGDYPDGYAIVSTGFHQDRPDGSGVHNFKIYDSEIYGKNSSADIAGIGQDEWLAANVYIHGSMKGARVDHNNQLRHSLIIAGVPNPSDHQDGVFFGGGPGNIEGGKADIVIDGNMILMADNVPQTTGAVALLNNYDGSYVTVTNNLLKGANGTAFGGGGYIAKKENGGGDYFSNVVVDSNIFSVNSNPLTIAFCDTCPGNTWTNNLDSNGNLAPSPGLSRN